MAQNKSRTALFPGTFDPITNGHVDVIKRAAAIFDELIIAVGDNPEKKSLLDRDRREQIVREVLADVPNVRVVSYNGLTVEFARKVDADVIVRGLRSAIHLGLELQMAMTNRAVTGIETVFVLPGAGSAFISSSLIRQIARSGGDVSAMVPPQALAGLHHSDNNKKKASGEGA